MGADGGCAVVWRYFPEEHCVSWGTVPLWCVVRAWVVGGFGNNWLIDIVRGVGGCMKSAC